MSSRVDRNFPRRNQKYPLLPTGTAHEPWAQVRAKREAPKYGETRGGLTAHLSCAMKNPALYHEAMHTSEDMTRFFDSLPLLLWVRPRPIKPRECCGTYGFTTRKRSAPQGCEGAPTGRHLDCPSGVVFEGTCPGRYRALVGVFLSIPRAVWLAPFVSLQ